MEIKKTKPQTLRLNIGYIRTYGMTAILLGLALFWTVKDSRLDKGLLIACASGLMAWGFFSMSRFTSLMADLKGLDMPDHFSITTEEIEAIRNEYSKENGGGKPTLLGKGFVWDNEIAENYLTITQAPEISRMVTSDSPTAGQYLIHNIGRKNDAYQLFDLKEHTAVLGTTGVGKSTLLTLMAAQRIMDGEAVIILDPKGDRDTLNTVYQVCCETGKESSFRFFSLAHLRKSQTYNPFTAKLRASDIASRIRNILGTPNGSNDAFINFSWAVVNVAADLLLAMNKQVTLSNIFNSIFIRPEHFKDKANAFLSACTDETMKMNLQSSLSVFEAHLINHDKTHLQKMIAGLKPILTLLSTKEIGSFLSTNKPSIDWDDVVRNKRIVYFYLGSMLDEMAASALGKLIVQDLLSWIGLEYAYKAVHLPVSLFGDEFYNLVFPGIADLLSKSRGVGFRAAFFMQTQADIAVKTKIEMAKQIFGNINNIIAFRVPEMELAEMISETSGTIFYTKRTVTRGTSATLGSIDQMFKDSQSERMDREAGLLITPNTLTKLAMGHAFLMTRGLPVIKAVSPRLDPVPLKKHGDFFNMINDQAEIDPNTSGYIDLLRREEQINRIREEEEERIIHLPFGE
jgi:conjugal transfer pilus assembly protein TraD